MKDCSSIDAYFHNNSGFTLIELMIVVAIVAILAAVAIPNYYGYKYRATRAEAHANIGAIYSLEEAYGAENEIYLTSAWTPATIPGSRPSSWQAGNNLDALGFSPRGDVYYRYGVGSGSVWVNSPSNGTVPETTNVDITIQAEGDVDGDGATSQFYTTDELKTIIVNTSNY